VLPARVDDDDPPWLAAYRGLSWERARDRAVAEGRPVRVLRPGSVVTMDHRPDRLNLHLDAAGALRAATAG
jgi:hypothetical protein